MLASLGRSEAVALPERHLGLVQAHEVAEELEVRFNAGADWLAEAGALKWIDGLQPVSFEQSMLPAVAKLLAGRTIGIARDEAFSFIYSANLRLLSDMGASLTYFSPIHDSILPPADALWLAGGYPELHAQALVLRVQVALVEH